jgi:hypothetical protein
MSCPLPKYTDEGEEEKQARLAIVAEAALASEAHVSYVSGEWTTWVVPVPREYRN